ncbi:uncharacterized protein LOC584267 [Strongylocentrotus purpuratus]|uniref:EF-hand domain-containing protein n=1 Tax=Strongylocentrotus purpuratus TaxID=7668 RepID=A0A7M7RFW8_STRPU|nr:uncharacterized protein LOC584267 [Strongylocentrotus purpuratus]
MNHHHAVNVLINMLLAATLLLFSLTLTQACGSKPNVIEQVAPTYDDKKNVVGVRVRHPRFRRGVAVEQEIGEEDGLTTPSWISNTEVFAELDLDLDGEVSVIEWSLEGGSVGDFWALLTRHDNNADELISKDEFAQVQVRIHL